MRWRGAGACCVCVCVVVVVVGGVLHGYSITKDAILLLDRTSDFDRVVSSEHIMASCEHFRGLRE
jgi:hypothetical protein